MSKAVRPDILISGFGPFPGVKRNPTAVLAPMVARILHRRAIAAHALILPTRYSAGLALLSCELQRLKPRAVLMLGLAGKSRFVRIERYARMDASPTAPDAGGGLPPRRAGAALPLAATAALEPALGAFCRAGLRARLSPSAGRYLCNAAYAVALSELPRHVPVLFVHVPWPRAWHGPRPAGMIAPWRPEVAALAKALAAVGQGALLRPARRPTVP